VAKEAGVRRLAMFHHDPAHDDDVMDKLVAGAQQLSADMGGPEVICAYEGLSLDL
jgi:phosphoribosyl 1,2-cyclic phosphodiesterase